MNEKVERMLELLHPEVKDATALESLPPEVLEQYARDKMNLEEYFAAFENMDLNEQSGAEIAYRLDRILWEKYMGIVFPGFSKMDENKRDNCMFSMHISNARFLDILIGKMGNPNDPMYKPKMSLKSKVIRANRYVNMYIDSKYYMKLEKTGRRVHSLEDWFKAEDEYINVPATDADKESHIEWQVEQLNGDSYSTKGKIKRIVNQLLKREIDPKEVIAAKRLFEALEPVRDDREEQSK